MIAMALACRPRLIIADEPTTALDVTIQAQILDLLRELVAETGAGLLLVTHDLGVVAEMADRVAVMYMGRVVEAAPVAELFARPRHPYTRGLLASLPRIDRRQDRLTPIEGHVPVPGDVVEGCPFEPRCKEATPACTDARPALIGVGHAVACVHAGLP
jgi:oligopeptide/dipeptide ABC transporter ATP-binding protein